MWRSAHPATKLICRHASPYLPTPPHPPVTGSVVQRGESNLLNRNHWDELRLQGNGADRVESVIWSLNCRGHRLPDDRCGLEGENSANYPHITHSVGMQWSGHKHILQRDGLIMGTHELQTLSEPWQKDIDRKVFGQTNQNYQGWETVATKHIQLFIPHSKTAVGFHPVVHLASIWHLLCEELC